MKLSILIPVLNERQTLPLVIERVHAVQIPVDKEIIVVDDGSTDGTVEWLKANAESKQLKVHYHPKRLGKGAGVRDAILLATGDFCVIQDADLEYHPREFPGLLQPLLEDAADAVFGSRFLGGPHRVIYFWNFFANKVLALITNVLFNVNLTDMETGYKMIRTPLLKKLKLKENRFGIEPELTAQLIKHGARLYETSISYYGRTFEEGKKIRWTDGVEAIQVLFRERFTK